MSELAKLPKLEVVQLACEPTEMVLHKQVLAMMLQPGEIEIGYRQSRTERYRYTAGDIALCRRHVEAFIRPDDNNIQVLLLGLSDTVLRELAGEKQAEVELRTSCQVDDSRLKGLMAAVNSERAAGFPSGRIFLESIEMALATVLVQGYALTRSSFRKYRGLPPARLRNVVDFIHSKIGEDLSLTMMAEVAGLSTAHFSYMFRESVGESPHQFILRKRIQHAKSLLGMREFRMLDVALACGFKTQQHFARAFRSKYGVSPTEYRRQILGQSVSLALENLTLAE
jgi:AraC family transcriptional regulator